jgi:hypothetical protein
MGEIYRKTEVTTCGLGLSTVLFLIFLVLKLCGIISWSWWWVTAPLWGGLAIVLACIFIGLIILGIMSLIKMILK